MSAAKALMASLAHPTEVAALIRYRLSVSDAVTRYVKLSNVPPEPAKGAAPPARNEDSFSYAMSYYFLNLTSRSFARVIQELSPELSLPVCIFYLVLRGLDTVEDDMTLDLSLKLRTLRSFHERLEESGWTFTQSGPDEKDAPLLVRFDVVIEQYALLKPGYRRVISDICRRMGHGMAEFCEGKQVETMEDYALYTHYVAGLVGIGLTGLFVESGLEDNPRLVALARGPGGGAPPEDVELPNEMGQFLQKVNIIKDYLEDLEDGRRFWPREVWARFVDVSAGEDLAALRRPERRADALACLNVLCVDALRLAPRCLEYMAQLREPSVLHFCAIPQAMAVATLLLFFNNGDVFERTGTRMRRGTAVDLIYRCRTFAGVKQVFLEHALGLARRNSRRVASASQRDIDASYWDMESACAEIVRWIQRHDLEEAGALAPPSAASTQQKQKRLDDATVHRALTRPRSSLPALADLAVYLAFLGVPLVVVVLAAVILRRLILVLLIAH
ncbi:Farnesyl-diphosphate farnesyltransferase [Cladochytrium tenue]|nr:Farnesyl-diphosphate farnesyltransferase [Cladochytrium tenue]